MSLVNDMLKDLEAGGREPLPPGVVLEDATDNRRAVTRRPSWLQGVALLVFVGAAFYLGLSWRQSPVPLSGEAEMTDSAIAVPMGRQLAVAARANSVSAPLTAVQHVDVVNQSDQMASGRVTPDLMASKQVSLAVANDTGQVEMADGGAGNIKRLLDAASRAVQENRLTSPIEDNAFIRYQAVLLLDAEHPQALEGIKNIAGRYLEFYATKLRDNDQRMANLYLKKAQRVTGRYPDLARWLDRRGQAIALQVASERPSLAAESVQAVVVANEPVGSEQSITVEEKSQLQPTMPTVRVAPSQSELDKRTAARGQTLMQQNRYAEAESLLGKYLADHPNAINTRARLIDVHLASGNVSAARQQLSLLTGIAEHEKAQLSARIVVHAGDIPAAIEAMEAAKPTLAESPGYYSYLAALYHKTARFQDAANIYQRLLATDQNQATYWLGLAVSLDALNDRAGALRAFRYARRLGKPDAPSRAYVEERIETLSG